MEKLIISTLLVICLMGVLASAESADQKTPDYSVSIIDLSPSGEDVDKPSEVTALFGAKKISGIGSYIKSDGRVPVKVTNYVELLWEPKAYTPSSVTNTYGLSVGSSSDTDKKDRLYYSVTSQNLSGNVSNSTLPFIVDFTFNVDVPAAYSGKVRDMYITMYAKSSAKTKIKMYDGTEWKTIRSFQSSSGETVEFLVGREYAQSNQVKMRLYAEDEDSYQIDVDYVGIMFRYRDMDVTFKIPTGASIEEIDDCCDVDTKIDYTKDASGGTFDLSEYVDFENKKYAVNYTYAYNITISDYSVNHKTTPVISSEDAITSIDLDYEKLFTLTSPFTQELKLEATPTVPVKFIDLRNSSKSYSITKDNGKIRFEIDTSNTVNLSYSLKDAISIKKELYTQVSADMSAPQWISKYGITRNFDSSLGALTLRHRLISNSSDTRIIVEPSADYTSSFDGNTAVIDFTGLDSDLLVTIIGSSSALITNHSDSVPVTNPIPAGTMPTFQASITFRNPSIREMKINVSREMVLSVLPEIGDYYTDGSDEIKPVVLKPGEEKTVQITYTSPAPTVNYSSVKQTVGPVNQPVEWRKTITVSNPGKIAYYNVSWNVLVPLDTREDYTINDAMSGEKGIDQITYVIENLSAGESKSYILIYSTSPVKKTEDMSSSGVIDKKMEKTIILNNPNSNPVKVVVGVNMSGMSNALPEDLEVEFGTSVLSDRDGDGVNDYLKFDVTLDAQEEKVYVITAASGDMMGGLGSLGSFSFNPDLGSVFSEGGVFMLPLVIGIFVIGLILVLAVVVRFARRNRRKKMMVYIAAASDAIKSLGGGQKQPTSKQ